MAKIIVNKDNFKVDELELKHGSFTIGRHKDNALVVDDLTVSGHHARIVTVFDSSYVEDLDSTNGTFVNGKRIKTHTLHNGDVLSVGHYQLLFQGAARTGAEANATRVIDTQEVAAMIKQAGVQQTPAKASNVHAHPAAVAAQAVGKEMPPPTAGQPQPVAELHVHPAADPQHKPAAKVLPDIDDASDILGEHPHPHSRMKQLRRTDVSPKSSLKVIVLAALTAAATFVLMKLVFKL